MPDEQLQPGEDWPEWGVRTGRYTAERAAYYRAQLNAERRLITASSNPRQPSQVEATIRSLWPVYAEQVTNARRPFVADPDTGQLVLNQQWAGAPGNSATPRLDALMREVYGPSHAERYAAQDAAAEAELARMEADEQARLGESELTADERMALFGDQD